MLSQKLTLDVMTCPNVFAPEIYVGLTHAFYLGYFNVLLIYKFGQKTGDGQLPMPKFYDNNCF